MHVQSVRGGKHPQAIDLGGHYAVAETNSSPPGLSSWDALGILAGFLLTLTITCVLSHGRIFWEDEMLGWMLLRDPSWRHMIEAWKMGADGGGFLFYLSGRAWFALFGQSEIAFRLYSSTCFGLAFAVTWVTARRGYGVGLVAFATFNTWFFNPPFIHHINEGRFYGLLVLTTALAFWLAVRVAEMPAQPPRWIYPGMFLVHGMLTTSHLLGVVYSGFLIIAMAATDRLAGRFRPMVYLGGAASWLLLIPERAAIVASAQVGKPHFWTTPPTLRRFLGVYSGFSAEIAVVLLTLLTLAAFTCARSRDGWWHTLREAFQARRAIYGITLGLLLVPFAFLLHGLLGTSLFTNRYLIPVTIALVYVTCEAAKLVDWQRILPAGFARIRWLSAAGGGVFALFLLGWVFIHLRNDEPSSTNYTDRLNALLPRGVPVVFEDAFTFTEFLGRHHGAGMEYFYLLDWEQSVSPRAPLLEVTQYHLMENWRKAGYFSGSIQDFAPFVRSHNHFLVVHPSIIGVPEAVPEIGNPFAERFAGTPGYVVRKYAEMDREIIRQSIWEVCKGSCDPSAAR